MNRTFDKDDLDLHNQEPPQQQQQQLDSLGDDSVFESLPAPLKLEDIHFISNNSTIIQNFSLNLESIENKIRRSTNILDLKTNSNTVNKKSNNDSLSEYFIENELIPDDLLMNDFNEPHNNNQLLKAVTTSQEELDQAITIEIREQVGQCLNFIIDELCKNANEEEAQQLQILLKAHINSNQDENYLVAKESEIKRVEYKNKISMNNELQIEIIGNDNTNNNNCGKFYEYIISRISLLSIIFSIYICTIHYMHYKVNSLYDA
jgi:hypothetical protein